ncbi:MAG TPA: hypothetical protein VM681_00095, partial [Candidatus Thermoplasmatota archaeon]|nr:hypothetical protein [Candidatus Thermoplasmatota archaeon]
MAGVLLLGSLLPWSGVGASEGSLPAGCAASDRLVACEWSFELAVGAIARTTLNGIPPSIVEIRVVPEGPATYSWFVYDPVDGTRSVWGGGMAGAESSQTAFADFPEPNDYVFELRHVPTAQAPPVGPTVAFRAVAVFHDARGRIPTDEIAGSPADPQIVDGAGDQEGPRFFDVTGGWFHQEHLDSGVLEVGLLAPNLRELRLAPQDHVFYQVSFALLGSRYDVAWTVAHEANPLRGVVQGPYGRWEGFLVKNGEVVSFFSPVLDDRAGTLAARIGLATIGNPPPGLLFANVSIAAGDAVLTPGVVTAVGTTALPFSKVRDVSSDTLRPFAVGGPAIWRSLRVQPAE